MNKIEGHIGQVLQGAEQGIYVIDSKGRKVFANQPVALMSGFSSLEEYLQSQDQFKGVEITDEFGNPVLVYELPYHKVLKDHQSHSQVLRIHTFGSEDGLSLLVHASPIFDSSGNFEYVLTSIIDLTGQIPIEGIIQQDA